MSNTESIDMNIQHECITDPNVIDSVKNIKNYSNALCDISLKDDTHCVLLLDTNGICLYANEMLLKIFGHRIQSIKGQTFHKLLPEDEFKQIENIFCKLIKGSFPISSENDNITSNGERIRFQWLNDCISNSKDGKVMYVICKGTPLQNPKCGLSAMTFGKYCNSFH